MLNIIPLLLLILFIHFKFCGAEYEISYVDLYGVLTTRKIRILGIDKKERKINAFCYLRFERRAFFIDRLLWIRKLKDENNFEFKTKKDICNFFDVYYENVYLDLSNSDEKKLLQKYFYSQKCFVSKMNKFTSLIVIDERSEYKTKEDINLYFKPSLNNEFYFKTDIKIMNKEVFLSNFFKRNKENYPVYFLKYIDKENIIEDEIIVYSSKKSSKEIVCFILNENKCKMIDVKNILEVKNEKEENIDVQLFCHFFDIKYGKNEEENKKILLNYIDKDLKNEY